MTVRAPPVYGAQNAFFVFPLKEEPMPAVLEDCQVRVLDPPPPSTASYTPNGSQRARSAPRSSICCDSCARTIWGAISLSSSDENGM
jgi:hypothetical protein